ncbi:hypothetical protein Q5H93_22875 [Hymenobacter sp. ASUV-10]|uniref:Uncharacterized protein n=1 Tax=Hymenobacter aranciens TaxID=3063996 RepID=A0ABT9BLR1_9BACT|nr:hypothetical protein [Hymenobacter sp. ASUV-10]MDO7877601.1 hypothetical protein [Hymenobacter sp. ASUV-10]
MFRLLLFFALLAGTVNRGFAQAGSPDVVSPALSDDALKGAIWTITAQHIWNTNESRAPRQRPAPWSTVDEFKEWSKSKDAQADKSGLTVLKNQVFSRFSGEAATPRQLVDTIVANVARAKKGTELHTIDAGALANKLNTIAGLPASPTPAAQTAPAVTATQPAPAAAPVAAPVQQPDEVVQVPPAKPVPVDRASFVAQHPAFSLGLAFVLGAVLGALLMALRQSQQRNAELLNAEESRTRLTKLTSSHDAFNEMKKQADDMKEVSAEKARNLVNQPPKKRPTVNPIPQKNNPPPAVPIATAAAASAPAVAAAPAPPVARYAPAQEGGYIEERKLVAEALPQLPIMLTVDARNPDRATFTLNPYANQGKLIGDGLEQLRDYFDYELPGRISSVAAAAPGQLVRQGDGWQVSTLARLEVR